MDDARFRQAWAAQAQALADQGVVECRMCRQRENLAGALQIWRNGVLVYAICERCTTSHDVLITPTEHGTEIRAKRRLVYVLPSVRGTG